jgi:hypothetical protein
VKVGAKERWAELGPLLQARANLLLSSAEDETNWEKDKTNSNNQAR